MGKNWQGKSLLVLTHSSTQQKERKKKGKIGAGKDENKKDNARPNLRDKRMPGPRNPLLAHTENEKRKTGQQYVMKEEILSFPGLQIPKIERDKKPGAQENNY